MKVLIAEDDAISRKITRRTVEKIGHECLAASDGKEALEIFENDPSIQVIVSDWMMPVMDGPELCRKVREVTREGYTFFVFLTALDSKEHLLQGMQAGADEYLTKPLDGEQLRSRLEEAARVISLGRHLNGSGEAPSGKEEVSEGGGLVGPVKTERSRARSGKTWDVLLAQGKINEGQIQRAVEVQREDPRDLGKILVSLGFITEEDLGRANAQRLRLEYIELSENDVDPGALGLVPEKMLRKHGVVPLRVEEHRLVVAVGDPTNIYALDDLKMVSGYPVRPVVASENDISKVQTKLFAVGEEVAGILEDAAGEGERDSEDLDLGVQASPDEKPVIRLVSSILQQAVSDGASDIHIEPRDQQVAVRFRVDGVLREVMSIPTKLQNGVIARFKIVGNLDIAERRVPQDGRFSVKLSSKRVDFRVASLPTVYGEKVVLRLLDTSSVEADLGKLGFAPEVFEAYEEVFRRPYGAVLVTGPTGSGKSTTLYATLGELNTQEKNIITVEDPVEFRMKGVNQVQVNPKAGLTFASGLRSILRGDPDIVMIGEIRDFETAKISVEAALTGHMVLTKLQND
ncbi:MAG: Flp pilus assembly complex ATPase component TadA [Rubrobacter sp.]|nr:Flp pilus assembly complex ATPase component TadA [Rubrobacter sp.]